MDQIDEPRDEMLTFAFATAAQDEIVTTSRVA